MSEENKLVFKPKDFCFPYGTKLQHTMAATTANKLFNQWLDKQVVVYGKTEHKPAEDMEPTYYPVFHGLQRPHDTHTARLVNITKIEGGE